MIARFFAFSLAVLTTHILAAAASTQSVLNRLAGLGPDVGLRLRLDATLHDIVGMASSLLPMIAAGFLVAFLVAGGLSRRLPNWRTWLYAAAGATALLAIHALLRLAFDITPIAGARSALGLLLQGLAGALGGCIFAGTVRPVAGQRSAR